MIAYRPGTGRPAFTLMELLMTISILAMLMTMLMPLLNMASREARKSATRSTMVKVDTALRLFRAEIGQYPYQQTYQDFTTSTALSDPASFSLVNRLAYHLGTDIADADRTKVEQDAAEAADAYYPHHVTNVNQIGTYAHLTYLGAYAAPGKPHAYYEEDFPGLITDSRTLARMANRLAKERVRRAVLAGNTGITGGTLSQYHAVGDKRYLRKNTATTRAQLPTTPLLGSPASAAKAGWAVDYLHGEIPAKQRSDEAVLDAWGRPLLYVCQASEGMAAYYQAGLGNGGAVRRFIAADAGLGPIGRTTLAAADSGVVCLLWAGKPLSALPDPANLRRSDRRYYAPPRLELEYELWSAGPDGRFRWLRQGPDVDGVEAGSWNADNVGMMDYDRNLP